MGEWMVRAIEIIMETTNALLEIQLLICFTCIASEMRICLGLIFVYCLLLSFICSWIVLFSLSFWASLRLPSR